jgi:hypothetical protein
MAESFTPDLSDLPTPLPAGCISDVLWCTPWTNAVELASASTLCFATSFAALIPGVQHGKSEADERILHIRNSEVFTQQATTGRITRPHINVHAPDDRHIAIRCWVVNEPATNTSTGLVLLLDRILQINGHPFILTDLTAHHIQLQEIMARLWTPDNLLQFNTVCRCMATKADELWTLAITQIPHTVAGIRFEACGAPSSASDRVWLKADATAPPVQYLTDVANGAIEATDVTMAKRDRHLRIFEGCKTHALIQKFNAKVLDHVDSEVMKQGANFVLPQHVLHEIWKLIPSSPTSCVRVLNPV